DRSRQGRAPAFPLPDRRDEDGRRPERPPARRADRTAQASTGERVASWSRMEAHTLRLLPTPLAVCQLPMAAAPSLSAFGGELAAVIRTEEELTVVCPESEAPSGGKVEGGWRA